MMSPLEVACFNVQSALVAAQNGASRIEFCQDEHLGGTTPRLSDFQQLRSQVTTIPIYVMIRPRGGSFIYTDEERTVMQRSIKDFDDAGADGFVLGVLEETSGQSDVHDGSDGVGVVRRVDQDSLSDFQWIARGKPCTFHRAFDEIPPELMEQELEALIEMGVKGVLTSGGARTAVEVMQRLRRLVDRADGRIDILVGGGVRSGNVTALRDTTGATWFHSSAIIKGSGEIADGNEVRTLREMLDS